MRFASFRQSSERRLRPALLALGSACLLLAPVAAGSAAPAPASFVYCLNQVGAKVFAGKRMADGSLAFGLSIWSPAGQNISVFGVAPRHGSGWRYSSHPEAGTAAERCRLDIARGADGEVRIRADPDATCQSQGGVNAEIGVVQFPASAYEGVVSTELDDPEAFQRAGKCVSASD